MKTCPRCGKERPLDKFYNNASMKDGKSTWCKECRTEYQRRYRRSEKGKESIRRYRRSEKGIRTVKKYRQTKKGKAVQDIAQKKKRKKYPEKDKASRAVNQAIYRGKLKKPDRCSIDNEECNGRIEGHHPDYSKPLDVVWLCHFHHVAVHHFTPDATTTITAGTSA